MSKSKFRLDDVILCEDGEFRLILGITKTKEGLSYNTKGSMIDESQQPDLRIFREVRKREKKTPIVKKVVAKKVLEKKV